MICRFHCAKTGMQYGVNFQQVRPGHWDAVSAFKLAGGRSTQEFGGGVMEGSVGAGPDYRCPHCGNADYFRCGTCGQMNCQGGAQATQQGIMVHCRGCRVSGLLQGYIRDLSGYADLA